MHRFLHRRLFANSVKPTTKVWAFGNGSEGQLGVTAQVASGTPAVVSEFLLRKLNVRNVSCGVLHGSAVTDAGEVYMWGDNFYSQVGYQEGGGMLTLFDDNEEQPTPMHLPPLNGTRALSCGYFHTVAIGNDDVVRAFGANNHGQLGTGDRFNNGVPQVITCTIPFRDVACGGFHSLALGVDGSLWGWGRAAEGQLGNTDQDITRPRLLLPSGGDDSVLSFAAGMYHSAVVTANGRVLEWGWRGQDMKYRPSTPFTELKFVPADEFATPREIDLPDGARAKQVICGPNATGVLVEDGRAFVLRDSRLTKLQVDGGIASLGLGGYHLAVVTNHGEVQTCGHGMLGQLGHGQRKNLDELAPVPGITNAQQVVCGWDFTIVL